MTKINPTREINWQDPEPRTDQRGNRGKKDILEAVTNSPGRWAVWNEACTHAVFYQVRALYPQFNWEYNVLSRTDTDAIIRVFVQFPLAKQGK